MSTLDSFEIGELVRVTGWLGTFRVKAFRLDGTVDVWGGKKATRRGGTLGLRTTTPDRLEKAKPGDKPPESIAMIAPFPVKPRKMLKRARG